MTTFDHFVRAFASPVASVGALDRDRARYLVETLYSAKTSIELVPVLDWFATIGNRRDYTSYEAHAGGAWKPDPRDRYVFRKAAFTIEHRERMKGRGLFALDAMRASSLVGWAVTAEIVDEAEAIARIAPIVTLALEKHASWADFAEQLLLGLELAEGDVEPGLRAAVAALGREPHPAWPEPGAVPTVRSLDAKKGDLELGSPTSTEPPTTHAAYVVLAMKLAIDCPGCELPLVFGDIVEKGSCGHCRTEVALGADDWGYFFADDARKRRLGFGDDDPITNDFGDRFFSRRITTKVASPSCPCGAALDTATLAPGVVECACGRSSTVRVADPYARRIDAKAAFVIAPSTKPIDPDATFACAACAATHLLGHDPSRVRVCAACQSATFVDASAHAQSFETRRRPTFYLVARR